ncbi:MAG: exodeoxyribonuclease VII small subunit [Lachnospiraceae bacterium]|nr:exodeoxyribonuclease VII small subunit [Lachnospiraceae bacterium]
MKIDEGFNELEGIIARMEKSDQPIEEAFEDFEKGMALVKSLKLSLADTEKKINVLNTETGELTEM